ncbi:MAG: hypothetical protein IKU99_02160, partial [Clostridia bacterium]|nr:hypothetical protein [Clostridia bacterium]
MQQITKLIRSDKEFFAFLSCLRSDFSAEEALPIAINGLSGGAETAFIAEAVRSAVEISKKAVLVLVPNESERIRLTERLTAAGINALGYKKRDLVIHNIRASHDVDRERLLVLSKLQNGAVEAIVATPTAALGLTMPPEMLKNNSLSLAVGDILAPEEMAERLVAMGYARVEAVESRGQFSRRGGILDFFGGEGEHPVRVEFFGDEVDRMSYFDPISQRTVGLCEGITLLPAAEVVVDRAARERILASLRRLEKKATDSGVKEKLGREIAIVGSDLSIDFRDKFLPLIYENTTTLFDYLGQNGRYISLIVGTNNCLDELQKQEKIYENDKITLQKEGLIEEKYSNFYLGESKFKSETERSIAVHVNSFSGGTSSMKLQGLFGFRSRRSVSYGGNFTMLLEDIAALRRGGYRILLLTENTQGSESLIKSLAESDIAAAILTHDFDLNTAEGGRIFVTESDAEGFDLLSPRIAVLSMSQDSGVAVMKNR